MRNIFMRAQQWLRLLAKQVVRPITGHGGAVAIECALSATVFRADGRVEHLGLISTKSVTDAWVDFLVDQMQTESTEFGDAKFHDSGTGSTAESAANTAMETKVETGRVTGTQTEGASSNIYRSVATIPYTATRALREHGLFTITSGGTLVDRSVFAVINVDNGDSVQYTYELTYPSGG